MEEKQEKVMYICTYGGENPDKAHLPFVMANAALAMDIKATVVLQGNGVYLAQKGYIDHILPGGGFPSLNELMSSFRELDGKLLVCVPCMKARNIKESDLIDGAQTTAAGALNVEAIASDAVFVY